MVPRPLGGRTFCVAHFYCGPRRSGDLQQWAEQMASARRVPLLVLSVDIVHGRDGDLTDPDTIGRWRAWVRQGAIHAFHGGPPCNTWTRARHRGEPGGPRAVRSVESLWGLPCLSAAEAAAVSVANALLFSLLLLVAEAAAGGGAATVEHPATFWREGLPAIWRTAAVRSILATREAELHCVDQCQLGLGHKGPTFLLALRCPNLGSLIAALPGRGRCDHGPRAHPPLIGRTESGWRTAAKRLYPADLGRLLARALLHRLPGEREGGGPVEEGGRESGDGSGVLEDAWLRRFAIPLGEEADQGAPQGWRDLDSSGLQAARAGEEAKGLRKAAALARIRQADPFIDGVLVAAAAAAPGQ